jgi:hypothetical protein
MYKSICTVAVLLVAFAFLSGSRSADASPATPLGPVIVAKGEAPNQTAPIPTTTLFTPTQDGLYRVSAYATMTKPGPENSGSWSFNVAWTDDAGRQQEQFALDGSFNVQGPFLNDYNFYGGAVRIFEAKAGTPITFNLREGGVSAGAEYSLYYTLERLE